MKAYRQLMLWVFMDAEMCFVEETLQGKVESSFNITKQTT